MNEADRDACLDAIAVVAAIHHADEEALAAILTANWVCPVLLERLIRALAGFVVMAVEDGPPADVDKVLALARQAVLEESG